MNFTVLEKSIWVLEKSWKFVSEKGYEPWWCKTWSLPHFSTREPKIIRQLQNAHDIFLNLTINQLVEVKQLRIKQFFYSIIFMKSQANNKNIAAQRGGGGGLQPPQHLPWIRLRWLSTSFFTVKRQRLSVSSNRRDLTVLVTKLRAAFAWRL